jgi:hypothetical protein
MCSIVLLSSCVVSSFGNKIEPSNNIVEKEYQQSAFDKVDIDAMANVKFVQGVTGDYRVVLSAPDNYHDLFKIGVERGKLVVDFKENNINIETKNVKILVYAPTLHELYNSGIARVQIDALHSDVLLVDNSGVGTMNLKGLNLSMLSVDCSGVGNIELAGKAGRAKMECSGVGNINAAKLKTRAIIADVSGVGGIECFVTDSLKADVSGVGGLKYAGNPKFKKLKNSGIGKAMPL